MASAAEVAAIDDFRFKNRIPTRAEAIRTLIEVGLGAAAMADKAPPERTKKRAKG